ncbi:trehalose-phosphatase [Sphingomonas hengshuiensis]|nr:trehalose-phosphatase [Sphingomonas hengshuiensis]
MLLQPPLSLLQGASLFLDVDGTLIELMDRPDAVVADAALLRLLAALDRRLDGRVAVVSGRSLAQLDEILGSAAEALALSGSHGGEYRWPGVMARPERPATLDRAVRDLGALAGQHPGALVEEKSYGVVFHYRMAPDAEEPGLALAAELARTLDLQLQDGNRMIELRVPGGNKGDAVRRLMERPEMMGTVPLFVGDDLTDEPAFEAVAALGGAGILVGPPRDTAARYALRDPVAVRAWLAEAAR